MAQRQQQGVAQMINDDNNLKNYVDEEIDDIAYTDKIIKSGFNGTPVQVNATLEELKRYQKKKKLKEEKQKEIDLIFQDVYKDLQLDTDEQKKFVNKLIQTNPQLKNYLIKFGQKYHNNGPLGIKKVMDFLYKKRRRTRSVSLPLTSIGKRYRRRRRRQTSGVKRRYRRK